MGYHVGMADRSMTQDPIPLYGSESEENFFELLKEATDTTPATSLETNEADSTAGTMAVHEDPPGRESGSTEAPWGEPGPTQDGHPQADHQSDGVWEGHKDDRQGVLDRVFTGRRLADKADQELMRENFENVAKGQFTTHSVHLQAKSVEKISHARPQTLAERVQALIGRT